VHSAASAGRLPLTVTSVSIDAPCKSRAVMQSRPAHRFRRLRLQAPRADFPKPHGRITVGDFASLNDVATACILTSEGDHRRCLETRRAKPVLDFSVNC
jgi:hypothetical protein